MLLLMSHVIRIYISVSFRHLLHYAFSYKGKEKARKKKSFEQVFSWWVPLVFETRVKKQRLKPCVCLLLICIISHMWRLSFPCFYADRSAHDILIFPFFPWDFRKLTTKVTKGNSKYYSNNEFGLLRVV